MPHSYQRQVQFADTDAAGVVHFSRLLCFVEEAEHEFLAWLNIPVLDSGGWPRVHISCDYLTPLRFPDSVEVTICPLKLGESSIEWSFEIRSEPNPVATGKMTTVRVDSEDKKSKIDEDWRNALETHLVK